MIFRTIDTETCSLEGGVIEVGSVDIIDGVICNPMSDFVKPDCPITFSAMALHHITESMVANSPSIDTVIPRYKGADYLIAHNAEFDRRMLPDMGVGWLCTKKLALRLWPDMESHSNQFLRYALGIDAEVPEHLHAHRALYDCYVTAATFKRIQSDSGWSADEMLEISNSPALLPRIHIGKYRGKTYAEVASIDPGWLRWALGNITDMSEDMRFTIKHHLKG